MKKIHLRLLFMLTLLLLSSSINANPYVIKLVQEGEDTYNISEYTNDKCTYYIKATNDTRVSQGGYIWILPNKTNGTYNMTYNFEGILPGTYNIHVVTLPKTIANETSTDLPVKYKVKLESDNQDGQEIETECGAFESVANEITDNVAEGIEITGNYAKITISGNASARKAKTETSEMYLDCIYIEREININPDVTFPDIAVNETNFPDENFRKCILMQNYGCDGILTPEEIYTVGSINVRGKRIQSLKGLEFFTSLTELYCNNNQLASINVSKNTMLKELYCGYNQLISLDVSNNKAITKLYCEDNLLTSINLSNNTALTRLYCSHNQLVSLDISQNTALQSLACSNNQLASLDLSKNIALTELSCGNNQLTSVTLGSGMTSIGSRAFEYCPNLTSVIIPDKVTSIGERAFYGCSGLTSTTIPHSVTDIGSDAFFNCTGELNINCNIPSAESFNTSKFYNSKFSSLKIGDSVEFIGDYAFTSCSSLMSVTIGNSVESIGNYAFHNCSNLTSITLPNSVTSIGNYAFCGCSNLSLLTIPNGVTSIGSCAFSDCSGELIVNCNVPSTSSSLGIFKNSKFISVKIGEGVESIGNYAFCNCSNLTSVTFPSGVTAIGNFTFSDCTNLTEIIVPNSVTSIGEGAFNGTAWYDSQPDGMIYIGKIAYKYKGTMPENTSISIEEGTLGLAGGLFYECSGLTSVSIPNSVKIIRGGAFYKCSGLTEITIPNNVIEIGGGVFNGCIGLTEIIIPNSLTIIGDGVFSGCSGLTSVTIGNNLTNLGLFTFDGCNNIEDVYCYAEIAPTASLAFYNVNISNTTLHVPEVSLRSYQTTDPWYGFGRIVTISNALRGDVNGDDIVNGTDIQAIINFIVASEYEEKADVNEDGTVNGTDIQEVINIIVNAE